MSTVTLAATNTTNPWSRQPLKSAASLSLLPKWHFLVKPFTADATDIELWKLVNFRLVIVVKDAVKAFDVGERYGQLEEL